MDEQSILLEALKRETPEARAAWLAEACGADQQLRTRIEKLIEFHGQAHGFPQQRSGIDDATIVPEPPDQDRTEAIEPGSAGAPAEGGAVVQGPVAHSVLSSLGASFAVPRVALRDSAREVIARVVRPKSPEMPKGGSDSRFQLHGEIARGGMGAILKGRDTDLGRDLAIKVLLEQHKDKPQVIQRFIEEAQIGGQLQHPGIVPIYELGQFADKRPFFAMKLVRGETLSKLLADRTELSTDRGRFIGVFEQACQTMAYAHSRGVIHRDLKPANIMVGSFGEVQVMDWGLAKVLAAGGTADEMRSHQQQTGLSIVHTLRTAGSDTPGAIGAFGSDTQVGSIMGTPAYMPPEQALGEIDSMDERADVFGLGAILCEILTGKPPYVGEDATQVFRMASRGKLKDCMQRLDDCGADPELIALAKHCLELEPSDRPRDARVLAERVSRHIESVENKLRLSETEAAVRAERLEQQHQSARKLHKMIGGLVVVSLVAIASSLVAGKFWSDAEDSRSKAVDSEIAAKKEAIRANEQRLIAQDNLTKADLAEKEAIKQRNAAQEAQLEALDQTYLSTLNEIRAMRFARQAGWRSAALNRIQNLMRLGSRNLDQVELRTEALACLAEMDVRLQMKVNSEPFNSWHVEFGPDGQSLAINTNRTVSVHDVVTNQRLRSIPKGHTLSPFAFHPSGPLTVPATTGRVTFHTLKPGQPTFPEIVGEGDALNLAFSKSGGRIAVIWGDTNSSDGYPVRIREVNVYDTETGKSIWKADLAPTTAGHFKTAMALSPDGRTVATISQNSEILLFTVGTDQPAVNLGKLDNRICALAFDPQGKRFVAGGLLVGAVWELQNKSELFRIHAPEGGFWDVEFSPDGQLIGGITNDSVARLWDAQTGRELVTAPTGIDGHCLSMAFSPGGDRIATSGAEATILEIEGRRECRTDNIFNYVIAMAFHKKQEALLASCGDSRVHSFPLNDSAPTVVRSFVLRPTVMRVAPDGRHVAQGFGNWISTNADDFSISVWPTDNPEQERRLTGPKKPVQDIAFDPTSQTLAAASHDGGLYLWEFETGTLRQRIDLPCNAIRFVDEDHLIVTTKQHQLVILASDGTRQREVTLPNEPQGIVITPDKREAFVGDAGGFVHRVRLFDMAVELSRPFLDQPSDAVMAVSPNGRVLGLLSFDRSRNLLIDPSTLNLLARLPEFDKRPKFIEFDPGGHYYAIGGSQLTRWDMDLVRIELTRLGLDFEEFKIDESATRFADAIRRAPSSAVKAEIIAAAASIPGLLDKLAERGVDEPQFHVELARHFTQQSKSDLADAHRTTARALFHRQLQQEPDNVAAASGLAELLLGPLNSKTMVPTSEKSGVEWRYATTNTAPEKWNQPDFDDSSWNTGMAPFGTREFSQARSGWNARHIWMRHDFELPSHATSNSFFLLYLKCDDFADVFLNGTLIARRQIYTDHRYIVFPLERTVRDLLRVGKNTLAVHCENTQGAGYIDVGLVALSDTTFARARKRYLASQLVGSWERLAVAYDLAGDQSALDKLLEGHPTTKIGFGNLCLEADEWQQAIDIFNGVITDQTNDVQQLVSRAKAYAKLNQWNRAQSDWRRVVALEPGQLEEVLNEFKRASRWNEAVEFAVLLAQRKSNDAVALLEIAPVLALADDPSAYANFCDHMVKRFAEVDHPFLVDPVIKACLLRPNVVDLEKLPSQHLDKFLDTGTEYPSFRKWCWLTRALLAYRQGDPESAMKLAGKSGPARPSESAEVLNLTILAMAHHQLNHPEEARRALDEASKILIRTQGDADARIYHDELIAQVLHREAVTLISGNRK